MINLTLLFLLCGMALNSTNSAAYSLNGSILLNNGMMIVQESDYDDFYMGTLHFLKKE